MRVAHEIFENHTLKALNIAFKKVLLPGGVKCGGTEGEIVVAHSRLPSIARSAPSRKLGLSTNSHLFQTVSEQFG